MGRAAVDDEVTVTVSMAAAPEHAFAAFCDQIDAWWLRGHRFRNGGAGASVMCFEARLGGSLFELVGEGSARRRVDIGKVTVWAPPTRLCMDWRNVNFAADEQTEVDVRFAATPDGCRVTLVHRRLSTLRAGHPAKHGLEGRAYTRMQGMWWGEQLKAYRASSARIGGQ